MTAIVQGMVLNGIRSMDLNRESCQLPIVSHPVKYLPVNGDGAVSFIFFVIFIL